MIVINGFDELLTKRDEIPDVGWLYVEESFDLESKKDINEGKYFIDQDEDEESELPVHPEEEQVGKDTNRSFVSYPRGEFAFL